MKRAINRKGNKQLINAWIVDDNVNYCKALAESLNSSNTIHCEAFFHSTASALKQLSTKPNPPSVLLLDIKMPVQTGLDSIEPILKISPHTVILMLSAVDDEEDIKTALKRGASGYLLKTSTAQDIVRGIETAFHGGIPLDPMITKKILSALVPTTKEKIARPEYQLSKRQEEVIKFIVKGLSINDIAENLNISHFTVETHIKNIYHKLNVHSKHTLVAKAYDHHLVD